MRNVSDLQGENEWQRKKKCQEHNQHFPQVSHCSRAKQRQRNVQISVLHVQSCFFFLLIRPTDVFCMFSLPSPLSTTRFYILFG